MYNNWYMRSIIIIFALMHSFLFSYYKLKEEIIVPYFSISDDCSESICKYIDESQKSIEFAIYIVTDKQIMSSLLKASERGVQVRGIVEKRNAKPVQKLHKKKIIKLRGRKEGLMHHKFMIIDRKYLLTGSYNYTYSADNKNDENFLLIKDPYLISKYLQEFLRLWDHN